MDAVTVTNVLTPGIQTRFVDMWRSTYADVTKELAPCMDFAPSSNGRYETYAGFKSAPHAGRWPRGAKPSRKGFGTWTMTVVNHNWEVGVDALEDDVADDRTQSLESRAADAAANMARLPERIFFQIEESQTNAKLLPAIPNAPDGAALFSATDGDGADRFGKAGGNIVTGTGVASVASIQDDYASTIVRAQQFLDTEGQPYYSSSVDKLGVTIVCGVHLKFIMMKAFQQQGNVVIVKNVAGTENVGAAAQTNPYMDNRSGAPVNIMLSPYKTTDDWSVWLHAAPVKAIGQQSRQPVRQTFLNRLNNSDCFNEKKMIWHADSRAGYFVNYPIGAIKVNN